ncbi:MAG: hypothetical protein FJ404_05170 [Verrucomicrobia bacterium]|nr:hypothetical protein [Verrucomicrobiota bacterium]
MLPVMQVGRVRPGAPPEHDVLHPVGGGLGQARPTNNIGIHGRAGRSGAFLIVRGHEPCRFPKFPVGGELRRGLELVAGDCYRSGRG